MIKNRKELHFYLMADRMMNTGYFKPNVCRKLKDFLFPDYLMRFLVVMRKYSYYNHRKSIFSFMIAILYKIRFRRLSLKLGFSIDPDAFGYGLSIPHYGTIVVGSPSRIGNYAVLQSGVCITGNGKVIGNNLYMATGSKITSKVVLGDDITIAANSVCNKSCEEGGALLAGMPAKKIKDAISWWNRDGVFYSDRVNQIETLKKNMNIL